MLSESQRATFERDGIVKLDPVFGPDDAGRMQDAIWGELRSKFDIHRDDPSTWNGRLPTGLKNSKRNRSFDAVFAPPLHGALDDLLGAGEWKQPKNAGQVLVTMPNGTKWRVPHKLWHVDFGYTLPRDRLVILKAWVLVDDIEPGGAGTPQIAGSHMLVADYVEGRPPTDLDFRRVRIAFMKSNPWLKALSNDDGDPDRNARFMIETDVDGHPVRVVELTGPAGTVYLTHPWVLHSASANVTTRARLMRSFVVHRNDFVYGEVPPP